MWSMFDERAIISIVLGEVTLHVSHTSTNKTAIWVSSLIPMLVLR